MRMLFHDRLRIGAGSAVLSIALLWVANGALAAWQEPQQQPPVGSPPGFVWTVSPSDVAQPGGQFNIAGSGKISGFFTALGMSQFGNLFLSLTGSQNLIYGVARHENVSPDASLLLLQTMSSDGIRNRLRVNRDGDLTVSGAVTGTRLCIGTDCRTEWPGGEACSGPVFVGRTDRQVDGARGGYTGVNAECDAKYAGSHLCTVDEVLQSISCGQFTRIGVTSGTGFWISGGPPGFTAAANDCHGWTSAREDELGRFWEYTATGGAGWLSSCNLTAYRLGCCR
ncbi:hypothetical protein HY480_00505 [Candidatus Uhrbacteria bacterium]|nr:hypothetical protein [Candidatus Uhrbacteria bacterium]